MQAGRAIRYKSSLRYTSLCGFRFYPSRKSKLQLKDFLKTCHIITFEIV